MVNGGVVAIVPARGGSKSIPRKNVRPLAGVPLIAYSIEAGLRARLVDRVIVSTDDDEIAGVAVRYGADVPCMRPAALAEDTTPDLPVFLHALRWLEEHDDWRPEIVVQLRPTSPLRPPDCVDVAVSRLRSDRTLDSVRGVVAASQNPYKMWRLQPDGTMAPLLDAPGGEGYNQPRQMLPATYWQTGHIDAIRRRTIVDQGSLTGARIGSLVIDAGYTCDIDGEADWQLVEAALARFDRPLVRPVTRARPWPNDLRLIVFDFDGVFTDNRVWVGADGDELVACDRGDGLGLRLLRDSGIDLFVLSTETHPVVGARCRKLGLPFVQAERDKARALRTLIGERGLDASQVVYVGNDVNDVECMRLVGCSVAVADAHAHVLREADLILTRTGGHGAVRELCDLVLARLSAVHT
jgi:YrbI family 3-deoxy-D-manno-octulosonate 8-phosphate phosphatase